jgi:glutaminyl-peptide cyclotransferase
MSHTRFQSTCARIALPTLLMSISILLLEGCFAQANPPKFDSANAFALLQKQCDFGPRPVGTAAHDKARDYLFGELSKVANAAELQSFGYKYKDTTYKLSNVIAHFGPQSGPGILLSAHWDTRPTADQELDAADQKRAILGANDGASGVAILLGMARMFHERVPAVPVTIVLFDGEDFGPTGKDMFLGARYFASRMNKADYKYGILLDMVGDKNLGVFREGNSEMRAKSVSDKIWKAAQDLGYSSSFKDEVKYTIGDDHVPLIQAGLPCADVIDFDYAYWHTLGDTVDRCSAESLRIVGETIAKVVYSEQPAK